ncbi:hypothetical protein HY639_03410 [Candidatus Woesearchaeota archaeon]|nr:hypothetical protein [Candidatus Woesearchaeota archaeon]
MDNKTEVRGRVGTYGEIQLGLGTLILGTLLMRGCVMDGVESKLDTIQQRLQNPPAITVTVKLPELKREHVIGGPAVEEFYLIDGRRAYIAVDGTAVDQKYSTER